MLYDLGVVILEKLDPNTGKVLVGPDGVIYTLKQGDKTILEGTEAAIRKFAQKIDEIRSSGGNSKKKVQEYLDELVNDLKKKHQVFLRENKFKIIRRPRSTKNIELVDEDNFIRAFGEERIDEFIRLNKFSGKSKLIKESKILLKNDKSKQHLIYNNIYRGQ